ncbi:HET-domain-containing protein [Periconia macrospinosa]|uniref:HET-domain-containing protein n=1 Tax=Periconia macrospinosa TaxID=97972 RepID=A0A2V1D131_9PLEO|nr:HET-domain-containing protein [Periconia macrospinosa]
MKNEIRVVRFLDPSNQVSRRDFVQCSIENVSLDSSFDPDLHQKYPQNQRVWDAFTKDVDLRDTTLEQATLDKTTYLGLSQERDRSGTFRHTWGDFEALSYTWGEGGERTKIIVNESYREVSANIEKALRALRDLKETGLGMCYWIDSLCIDQENETERNKQVKRMNYIYGRARAVIVWLGQEEEMDMVAAKTMRHLCRNPYVENPLRLPADLLLNGWPALYAFMQKPYWSRSWIIQELAMNHNSTLILCGKLKFTRRMIRLGVIYLQECLQASEDLRTYRLINLTCNPNVEGSLDRLLNIVRQADATDKKDKVYGILGLLDPAIFKGITADYALRERDVYTKLMISIVTTKKRLEQIVFGGIPAVESWPSWVPDWRLPFERNHVRYLRSRRASGNEPAKFEIVEKKKNISLLVEGSNSTNLGSSSTKPELSEPTYFQKFQKFREYNEKFRIGGQSLRDFFPQSCEKSIGFGKITQCLRLAMLSLNQRALITTRTGYLGLAPNNVRSGDIVAILLGCNFPMILRPCTKDLYHVVGECYVHGLMDGEILRQKDEGIVLERNFVLS